MTITGRTVRGALYTDEQLENISCGCLLACAFVDFAKARARAAGAARVLRFLSEGRDRFLLDALHAGHMAELKNFRHRSLLRASAAILAARFRTEHGSADGKYWAGLESEFVREYARGRVNLFEIDWE